MQMQTRLIVYVVDKGQTSMSSGNLGWKHFPRRSLLGSTLALHWRHDLYESKYGTPATVVLLITHSLSSSSGLSLTGLTSSMVIIMEPSFTMVRYLCPGIHAPWSFPTSNFCFVPLKFACDSHTVTRTLPLSSAATKTSCFDFPPTWVLSLTSVTFTLTVTPQQLQTLHWWKFYRFWTCYVYHRGDVQFFEDCLSITTSRPLKCSGAFLELCTDARYFQYHLSAEAVWSTVRQACGTHLHPRTSVPYMHTVARLSAVLAILPLFCAGLPKELWWGKWLP